MSGDDDSVGSVGDLSEVESPSVGVATSESVVRSDSSSSSSSSDSSLSVDDPLLMCLVLAVIPGEDSVLFGSPSVRGQAPSAESDVEA